MEKVGKMIVKKVAILSDDGIICRHLAEMSVWMETRGSGKLP